MAEKGVEEQVLAMERLRSIFRGSSTGSSNSCNCYPAYPLFTKGFRLFGSRR